MRGVDRKNLRVVLWLFVFLAIPFNGSDRLCAADFSVVTRLFSSSQTESLGENTTLFRGENVYDLPADGDQITFFEGEANQFILLDTAKKRWTRISTEQLLAYTAWLKERSLESDDPLLRFCAAPQFEIHSEKQGKWWHFDHPLLGYRVETDTYEDLEIGRQYRSFSDWYARLNAMLHSQSLPPFPRLAINQRLAQEDLLPRTVRLRISPSSRTGREELTMRSVHQIRPGLSDRDRERLAWIENCRRKFPEVSLTAYRQQKATETK